MKRIIIVVAGLLAAVPAFAHTEEKRAPEAPGTQVAAAKPKIQIAILLDTSSSMDGLINQAREQLWKVVNTFATAKRDGVRPQLEIALYEYGNSAISSETGYIRLVSPLSTNLDAISEKLFSLKTNGGDEYCGQVIAKATDQLEWSRNPKDLKLIYIAGNEPFTQGRVDFRESVKAAISKGIVVNTIHCGSEQEGIDGQWKAAALLADGNFLSINQNQAVAYVAAPQDAEIARLGAELNKTYVSYGRRGVEAKARQESQDKAAEGSSAGVGTARAVAKSSAMYTNSEWDLVDARKDGKKVAEMKEEELPAELQKLAPKDREAYVEKKAAERAEIAKKIATLNGEREKFVAAELKKKAGAKGDATLDEAVITSVKSQGTRQAWSFE